MMKHEEYLEALATIDWLISGMEAIGAAEYLEVHNVHIYNAKKNGIISPTLEKAMRDKGCLDPLHTRCRISADVSPEQREALHALAAGAGLTWSEYCRRLADGMD